MRALRTISDADSASCAPIVDRMDFHFDINWRTHVLRGSYDRCAEQERLCDSRNRKFSAKTGSYDGATPAVRLNC